MQLYFNDTPILPEEGEEVWWARINGNYWIRTTCASGDITRNTSAWAVLLGPNSDLIRMSGWDNFLPQYNPTNADLARGHGWEVLPLGDPETLHPEEVFQELMQVRLGRAR